MKLPFGSLWSEFKAFAFKGNMIELAVAVIIGGAFGTVVTSLTNDVIMPTIGYVINKGEQAAEQVKDTATKVATAAAEKTGLASSKPTSQPATGPSVASATPSTPSTPATTAPPVTPPAAPAADDKKPAEPIKIDLMIGPVPVGKFIGALLNFFIVAFAVFLMVVKLLGTVSKRMTKPVAPSEPTTRECPECLSIIPIKAKRCSYCTAVVAPAP